VSVAIGGFLCDDNGRVCMLDSLWILVVAGFAGEGAVVSWCSDRSSDSGSRGGRAGGSNGDRSRG
jgi:hypothetical protein